MLARTNISPSEQHTQRVTRLEELFDSAVCVDVGTRPENSTHPAEPPSDPLGLIQVPCAAKCCISLA